MARTIVLSRADFSRAGVVKDAFGVTYADMEEDLRDLVRMTTEDRPDLGELPDGPVDLLLNNVQHKQIDSAGIPSMVAQTVKLGSSFIANAKTGFAEPAQLIEIAREIWRDAKAYTPFDTGTARNAITYVKGRAGGTLGVTSLHIATWISERDLEDPLDVVGVTSPVDYASVLEIRGFTRRRITPMKRAFQAALRKHSHEAGIALRFIPSDQIGRPNYRSRKGYKGVTVAGVPTGGAYNVPVVLVGQLGVQIEQTARRRTSRPRKGADNSRLARARIKFWRR